MTTQPPIQRIVCWEKWPGLYVNHSRPSSAKVENEWSYTSTPHTCFQGVGRDNFTFRFTTILVHRILRWSLDFWTFGDIWRKLYFNVKIMGSVISAVIDPYSSLHAALFTQIRGYNYPHKIRTGYSITSAIYKTYIYRGADKSLAWPTFRFILFDGENISFDASLVIYI